MYLLYIKGSLLNVYEFLNKPLFPTGSSSLSVLSILIMISAVLILFFVASKIKRLFTNRILRKYNIEYSTSLSIATLVKYIIIVIGLLIIFQSSGIDLSTLSILFGALGVGIGFGLQNITNNFISGIIILFEKPIKIGDRVEVSDAAGNITAGNVINISARATTIITNDDVSIIIPNSDFVSQKVINWSHNDRKVRLNFPVYVSHNEDPENVKSALLEVAKENPAVYNDPKPDVLFDSFENSSLKFNLRIWTSEYIDRPNVIKSQLYYAVFKKFKEKGIKIPYPQRDLHLISGFEKMPKPEGS